MKERIVGKRELLAYAEAMAKLSEESLKLKEAVDASHDYLFTTAERAPERIDVALATGNAVVNETPRLLASPLCEARNECTTL